MRTGTQFNGPRSARLSCKNPRTTGHEGPEIAETLAAAISERFATSGSSPCLRRDDRTLSYAEVGARAARWAQVLLQYRRPGCPFHVGMLAENSPAWIEIICGCLLAGATLVGLNTTRRGAELARDAAHTECCVVLGDEGSLALLGPGERHAGPPRLTLGADSEAALASVSGSAAPGVQVECGDIAYLIFTSGTTSAPKAVIRTQGRALASVQKLASRVGVTPDDVGYVCMPLFHAAALTMVALPALVRGASLYVAPRFSVSRFLPDVRRHGCTWFGYTGKPLTYLLTAPERPDDADNPLRVAMGNEGNSRVCDAFARRFACKVVDLYGATEGGVGIVRQTGDPPGSMGRAPEGVRILDENGAECATAEFDAGGRLANPDEAVGEIVNTSGVNAFEGYWRNDDATRARGGADRYRSGDLGYMDRDGFVYFAGRTDDWLRVDGENFSAAAVEQLLERHPDVLVASVFGVPDADAGDQVMAVLQRRPGAVCDPAEVLSWMRTEADCGTKWPPRYVRVVDELPLTASNKVRKRDLRRVKFFAPGTLERTPEGLAPVDAEALRGTFRSRAREHLLDL